MICDHLQPFLAELKQHGYEVKEGSPFASVKYQLDVVGSVDLDRLQQAIPTPACVETWTDIQQWFPPEQGLICRDHQHALAWRISHGQIQWILERRPQRRERD